MGAPANIRVNTSAPFPSLVSGQAPITITKTNGIWQVGFSAAALAVQNPPQGNLPTDYAIVWDSINKTFILVPLSTLVASPVRAQRSITAAGNLPVDVGDSILNINAASDLAPVVPAFGTRSGAALTFKNLPGSQAQTLTATNPDTLDGQASIQLAAGASVTLVPYNDGVNSGYAIE